MLHTVHQGIGPYALAGLITHHFEEMFPGLTLQQLDEKLRGEAWGHYKIWRKGKSVVCPTSSVFTGQRFGRDSWQSYPELSSHYKGAMVKYLIFWVSDFLKEKLSGHAGANYKLRSYCAWALAHFQFLQETNGPWLDDSAATAMHDTGRTFLLFYQKLVVSARAANVGRSMYKVVPKNHCLLHLCRFVRDTKRNPRFDHLYSDEDFMRHVAKICTRCHPKTMDVVALHRYRTLIELGILGQPCGKKSKAMAGHDRPQVMTTGITSFPTLLVF